MLFDSVINGCGEQVYIPPSQAFPWWERPILRLLSRQMICRLHRRGRVISGDDLRLRHLFSSSIGTDTTLESGKSVYDRLDEVSETPRSPLGKRLDAIIWEYMDETKDTPETITQLQWAGEWKKSYVLDHDLRVLARECMQRLIDEINLSDRHLLLEQERQKAVAEQLRQGEVRELVAKAQMLHDDLTVCRPAKPRHSITE